jgi:hypothetical protein
VTLPFFEVRAQEARYQSGVEVVAFAPLVSKEDKDAWEAYAVDNQGWIQEGLEFQDSDTPAPGHIPESVFPREEEEGRILAPLWQVGPAPVNAGIVNLNLLSLASFDRLVDQVLLTREAAVSEVIDVLSLISYEYSSSGEEQDGEEARSPSTEDADLGPSAFILQPVYESFNDDARIVGVVFMEFKWSLIFKNDELIVGMFAILNDSCGTSHTYFIDEGSTTYMGQGDLHERQFDHLGTSKEFELSESEEEEEDEDRKRERRIKEEEESGENDDSMCEVWYNVIAKCIPASISDFCSIPSTNSISTHRISCSRPTRRTILGSTLALFC